MPRPSRDPHVRASKFMSLVLRHEPGAIGLSLDPHGWASIDDLVRCSSGSRTPLSRDLILEIAATSDKQRFRISDDGLRIRASHGHSIDVDLELVAREPPEILHHGTAKRFLASILAEGLRPGARRHVHLSTDHETALRVGQRHGEPLVLLVLSRELWLAGTSFYLSDNGVWLTDLVPPRFLQAPADGGGA